MIGVAILGVGDIANVHIEAYQRLSDRCEIRALVNRHTDKAEEKKKKYGLDAKVYGDYHEILGRDDIQLVSVCLPPAMHCEVTVGCLEAGKHVLCEKPMAPTLEECDAMIAAAKQGGVLLSCVAQNRFKQDIMRTKQLLESGAIGKPLFAQTNSLWWRGNHYYDLWWRGTWEKEGGGCTLIHAVHHIDLLLWMMGNVKSVCSLVANQSHTGSEVEDVSISTIRFENGAVGTLVSSLLHHGEGQQFVIDAEKGTIEIPHKIAVSRQLANGYPEADEDACRTLKAQFAALPELSYTEHCGQIENVLKAIETGTVPLIGGADGRRTVEFISGVYQSAFFGKPTVFPMTKKDAFYTRAGILKHATRFYKKEKSVENLADLGISVGGTL